MDSGAIHYNGDTGKQAVGLQRVKVSLANAEFEGLKGLSQRRFVAEREVVN